MSEHSTISTWIVGLIATISASSVLAGEPLASHAESDYECSIVLSHKVPPISLESVANDTLKLSTLREYLGLAAVLDVKAVQELRTQETSKIGGLNQERAEAYLSKVSGYPLEKVSSAKERYCYELANEIKTSMPQRARKEINRRTSDLIETWLNRADSKSLNECLAVLAKSADVYTNLTLGSKIPLDEGYSKVSSDLIRYYSIRALLASKLNREQFDSMVKTITTIINDKVNADKVSSRYFQCISLYEETSSLLSESQILAINTKVTKSLGVRFKGF